MQKLEGFLIQAIDMGMKKRKDEDLLSFVNLSLKILDSKRVLGNKINLKKETQVTLNYLKKKFLWILLLFPKNPFKHLIYYIY